jgi:hypothetical protein
MLVLLANTIDLYLSFVDINRISILVSNSTLGDDEIQLSWEGSVRRP